MNQNDPEWPMGWKWAIFGGSISRSFEPAVRKGCEELMVQGAIAGYPLQGVRIFVTDGKEHTVDSKEVAFRAAGKYALKEAIANSKPIILEPIVNLEGIVPLDYVGAITGDLASRRGRPVGQDNLPGGMVAIKAIVALSEMSDYASSLSSATGGQGSYTMEFASYEPAPGNIIQDLVKAYAARSQKAEE
jgi:elongation factor G